MKRARLLRSPGRANVAYHVGTPRRYGQGEGNLAGEVMFADPLRLFPGQWAVYNPSALVGRQGMQIFDKMRRDDQCKAALSFKKFAALSTGWEVVSPKGMPEEWEPTEYVRTNFLEITDDERTLDDILVEVLSALDFGFSVSEKLFDDSDGVWLSDVKTRAPHMVEFKQDVYGNLQDIRQTGTTGGTIVLPQLKAVLYVHQREFSNLYGVSDLESAYRAWVVKDNAYKWLAMYLEKLGIPPIFALYNPSAYFGQPLEDLKTVMERMQAATFGAMPRRTPDDLAFWSPELGGQTQSVFMPALDMFNRDISRAILLPSMIGFTADQAQGSLARSRTHFDSFMLVVERVRKLLTSVVQTQMVRQLVDLNFGEPKEGYPQFRLVPMDDDTRAGLLDKWTQMVSSNIATAQKSDEAHIRRILQMPERVEGDEMPPPSAPPTPFAPGGAGPLKPVESATPEGEPANESEVQEKELQALLESANGDWEKVREPLTRLFRGTSERRAA